MNLKKVCLSENCEKLHHAKGYCQNHYQRFKAYRNPLHIPNIRKYPLICTVQKCCNPCKSKGYCSTHYHSIIWKKINKKKYSVVECTKPHHAKSFCKSHSRYFKLYLDPLYKLDRRKYLPVCSLEVCQRSLKHVGYVLYIILK